MFVRVLLVSALLLGCWPGTAQADEWDSNAVETDVISDYNPLGTQPAVLETGPSSMRATTLSRCKVGLAVPIDASTSRISHATLQVSFIGRGAAISYIRADYAIHMALSILVI